MDAERKRQIDEQFGRAAEQYAVSEHRTGKDLDIMIELATLRGDERVLDIATGAGHTALAFAPRVARVVVTDMADRMVDKARALFAEAGLDNAEFKVIDAQSLPFADEEFDVVTCRIAPHHFLDIKGATREVARVLKPGGCYIVVDSMSPDDPGTAAFLHQAETLRDPTHVRSYTKAEWADIAESAGLVVEHLGTQRKRRAFDFWLERGGADEETSGRLADLFLNAPADAKAEFEIEIEDGKVGAFSDDKIVLLARRP
jgi:ubiquinone/menaquinone biosynthesis C-methylase UbiE